MQSFQKGINHGVALFLLLVFGSAHGGPFGLQMGESLANLKNRIQLKQSREAIYTTEELPNGHEDFESYTMFITPEQGLCKVMALSDSIKTNSYGDAIKVKFDSLFEALTKKYGDSDKFNRLRVGSIWDEPRDWMMGLQKKERDLVAYWPKKKADIPDQIKTIKLEAHAYSTEGGYVSLTYEFKNIDDCVAAVKAKNNEAL